MHPLIDVRGLHKSFGATAVLRGVDLVQFPGECVALIGASGCGKSTWLRCLNQLETHDAGTIRIAGYELRAGGARDGGQLRRLRQTAGMIFQQFHLFPHRTALENVMEGPRHVLGRPRDQAEAEARKLLGQVGLESRCDHRPAQLSGGQQQRVAIARALALQPQVLLLDEPTSALDPESRDEVREVLTSLGDAGMTMVLVTHDLELARRAADRVLFLAEGLVAETNTAEQFFADAQSERAREFLRRIRPPGGAH